MGENPSPLGEDFSLIFLYLLDATLSKDLAQGSFGVDTCGVEDILLQVQEI